MYPNVTNFSHLRPISLCNVAYKIISKILVARLRPFLDRFISANQFAFVPRRWIGENSVLLNEILHTMRRKRGQSGYIGIKVDMQKAFDRVEWGVLCRILNALGFSNKFVNWISECISTTSSEILLNGRIWGGFQAERGLRQGDPLSPFLFISLSELLPRILNRAFLEGAFQGVKVSRTASPIDHLLFANDLVLFCRADCAEVANLKACLEKYCIWTGQRVNLDKSGIFFSSNIPGHLRGVLKRLLGLAEIKENAKYLGNPMFIGQSKRQAFNCLKERVTSRLDS